MKVEITMSDLKHLDDADIKLLKYEERLAIAERRYANGEIGLRELEIARENLEIIHEIGKMVLQSLAHIE